MKVLFTFLILTFLIGCGQIDTDALDNSNNSLEESLTSNGVPDDSTDFAPPFVKRKKQNGTVLYAWANLIDYAEDEAIIKQCVAITFNSQGEQISSSPVEDKGCTTSDIILKGVNGKNGLAGIDGNDGVNGNNGSEGLAGADGSNGSDGSSCYLDHTANKIVCGNDFISITDLSAGPKGDDGNDGAQGSQGNDGFDSLVFASNITAEGGCGTGVKIDRGLDVNDNGDLDAGEISGTQYLCDGATGSAGSDGSDGSTGATGSAGSTGATGSQGTQGIQGVAGSDGAAGSTGSTGSTGATGSAGADALMLILKYDTGSGIDTLGFIEFGEYDYTTQAYSGKFHVKNYGVDGVKGTSDDFNFKILDQTSIGITPTWFGAPIGFVYYQTEDCTGSSKMITVKRPRSNEIGFVLNDAIAADTRDLVRLTNVGTSMIYKSKLNGIDGSCTSLTLNTTSYSGYVVEDFTSSVIDVDTAFTLSDLIVEEQ